MNKNIFLIGFFLISALNVIALIFEIDLLFTLTKPLLVLSLIAHYILNTSVRSNIFIFALLFCLTGDVLLMFVEKNELFFMGGLVAFLVGHILYIITYRQHQQSGLGEELLSTQ